jgi:4-hydroxy-3-methylbut-2-en-1-yl diphosphate reductase
VPAFLINGPEEINPDWLKNVQVIGLTAGASTPENIVQECINQLVSMGVSEVEDVVYTVEDVVFQIPRQLAHP